MRFRFTGRDLLWLTVVVALALGWRVDRSRLASERREFEVQALGYKERRDFYHGAYAELFQIMKDLAEKPENQELKSKLNRFINEVQSD